MKLNPRYLISIALLLAFILSCAVNPVTGKRELMLLSEADEIALGQQSDKSVVQTYGIYDDPELTEYVVGLAQKMTKLSHRAHLDFQFRVMDSPVINAFAVPGGYLYFTRGILAYLNSEAEFAGVIGHEIGHVTARHSAKQYSKQQIAQLGLGLGVILSEKFQKYAGVAQFGVGMLFMKHGRDHERESDRLGVEYSTKAGYDARHMANFFKMLNRMQPSSGGGIPDWFSTHPNPAERVQNITRMAEEWQSKLGISQLKVNRNAFLNRINGVVFGEDPRQGFVENNVFYHPQMKFYFPLPAGWKLQNTPSQVQIFTEKQDAVVMFTLGEGASPAAAAQKFISGSNAVVIENKSIKVNGFPAHKVISDIADQQNSMRVVSHFIKDGASVFVFHGFTAQASFDTYRAQLESPAKGFKRLRNKSKLNVKPDRLAIKKVTRAGTLQSVLTAFKARPDDLEKLSLMNGMLLTDLVKRGTLIKTIKYGR